MTGDEIDEGHDSPGDSESTWAGIYLTKLPGWGGRK
jgi:hypothetical protein